MADPSEVPLLKTIVTQLGGVPIGQTEVPLLRQIVELLDNGAIGGGSGTVTSVGLSLPSIFSVSGSPVTTSGDLTGTLATQAANKVWAGPTTGAAATPTFRALVNADIPAPGNTNEILFSDASLMATDPRFTWNNGALVIGQDGTASGQVVIYGSGAAGGSILLHNTGGFHAEILNSNQTGDQTFQYPDATGTLVLEDNASTLTNKTISGASNTLTNIGISSLTGLGTGVDTALAINVGTSGSFVVNGGVLGTPSSGTLTNCTGLPPAGVVGTAAILGANTFTRLQTITQGTANESIIASTGYSVTGAGTTSMVNLAGTLNTSGNVNVLYSNITNTASGSDSRLIRLDVGGAHRFSIKTNGDLLFGSNGHSFGDAGPNIITVNASGSSQLAAFFGGGSVGTLTVYGNNDINLGGFGTAVIGRDGADHIVALKSGTSAQTFRVYGTFTDASNYVRASLSSSSTLVTLAAETAGTGADNVDINLTTAGTGLVNLATQSPTTEAVVSDTTVQIKVGGTTYKMLLKA